ncbi:hypothetical protein Pst134EB_023412 [Puccinia striiformis f. sp. tritici]|nr:hypothetical protein Pst134EB_023412 [Puccinia striiformis f. sp. tritici]
MSDEDKVLLPRSIRSHEFYKGARESFICLMESEGVAGPRDELPVGLPMVFGSDVTLQKPLQSLVARFAEVFGPIAKVLDKPRTIEHLVQTGNTQPGPSTCLTAVAGVVGNPQGAVSWSPGGWFHPPFDLSMVVTYSNGEASDFRESPALR